MNLSSTDVETLRRLVTEQPEATATRALAIVVSIGFLLAVLELVRRGRLREEYTPIWVVVGASIFVASIWFELVWMITRAVGAWTPSSTLFFFGEIFLLAICLQYAVRLSALNLQVKSLAQELAILRAHVQDEVETVKRPAPE